MKRQIQMLLMIGTMLTAPYAYTNPIQATLRLSGSLIKNTWDTGKWFMGTPFRSFFTGIGATIGTQYGILENAERKTVLETFKSSFTQRQKALLHQMKNLQNKMSQKYELQIKATSQKS